MDTHVFQFDHFDPDQLREVINGSELDHSILDARECSARVIRRFSAEFSVDCGFYSFPVLVRGQFAQDRICIGMSEGSELPTWVNGIRLDRPSLQVYAEGTEMLYRAGRNTNWMGLSISRSSLQEASLRLQGKELPLPSTGLRNFPVSHEVSSELFRILRNEPGAETSPLFLWTIVEALQSAATESRGSEFSRFQLVSRCDRVLRHMIGHKYSSEILTKVVGASERSIQLHFRDAFGMSPKSWFTILSLNQARSQLMASKHHRGVVADVAMTYGFEHLGRFSEKYRELFSELPSDTVRRLQGSSR